MNSPHAKPSNAQGSERDRIVRVLLPLPLGHGYDYLVPEGLAAQEGSIVSVPLGRKESVVGVVWGAGTGGVERSKIKPIIAVLDPKPVDAITRRFIDWVAAYTLTPPGLVLKMMFGGAHRPLKAKDVLEQTLPDPAFAPLALNPEQTAAASLLVQVLRKDTFGVTLLDGVTGSGKTEVYAEALSECFRKGRQALLLLPEIAMTTALFSRLESRFGVAPTLWHSALTDKQRRLNWHAIRQGKARFILGARSALFLPYDDLGLIVVDEEHDGAYKQEEGVIYHGRDMAVVRAKMGNHPLILASATPSLETLHNVQRGKYAHAVLPARFGAALLPDVRVIDLRSEKLASQNFISDPLLHALEGALGKGQQAMLFLNRRGYAPLTLCRACGHRLQCPSCTSWMIEHKRTARLHCHQCGHSVKRPNACPVCGAEGALAACGPGVERIAEEVAARLQGARIRTMTSDTVTTPVEAQNLIDAMEGQAVDLLIGTQMMAKGYHFPRLTVVGVIDADLGLAGGDPRAAERTFQLLQQVAGRSGRAKDPGAVYLQTVNPEHPVIRALKEGSRDAFFQAELRERQAYRLPPFGRLASLTIAGKDEGQVIAIARLLAAAAPQDERLKILGPAPAPFALLRGKHRYRLMLQAPAQLALSAAIAAWLAPLSLPRAVTVQVDIDPYSFL